MFYYAGYNSTTWNIGDLSEWKTSNVTNMSYMFSNAGYNSTTWNIGDLSEWNTSNVTNMSSMFSYAGYNSLIFYAGDLGDWNTSNVTSMSWMFAYTGYNSTTWYIGDLSNWDTRNVTSMGWMFESNNKIRVLDLTNWDTSKVTDMMYMFDGCTNLKTIYASNKFVTNLIESYYGSGMFSRDYALVGGHGTAWNSNIINETYAHIDGGTTNPGYFTERPGVKVTFDSNGGIVTNKYLYYNVGDTLGQLQVPRKEDYIFIGWYTELTGGVEIDENTVVTEDTTYYAHWRQGNGYTITFDPNIEGIDEITRVVYEESILGELPIIERDDYNLYGWFTERTGGVEISALTVPTSDTTYYARWEEEGAILDVGSSVNAKMKNLANSRTDMTYYTEDTIINSIVRSNSLPSGFIKTTDNNIASHSSDYPIYIWFDNSNGTIYYYCECEKVYFNSNSSNMFYYFKNIESIPNISSLDTSHITNMSYMFGYAGYNSSRFELDLSSWDTSRVKNMSYMFNYAGYNASAWNIGDLSNWNTSRVTNMNSMFQGAGNKATTFDIGNLSNWDTSKVTNMSFMFSMYDTESSTPTAATFNIGDLSNWNTSSVTSMRSMFQFAGYNATTFNIGNLSNWDTSLVTDMGWMFNKAGRNASTWNVGDLSNWDTSKVTNMKSMFNTIGYNVTTLNFGNLSNWDTSQVTDMSYMFYETRKLRVLDVSNWNTSNVTTMEAMFYNCNLINTLDVRGWNTSKVTSMGWLFYGCSSLLGLNLSDFDTSQVTNMKSMFCNDSSLTELDLTSFNTSKVTNMSFMFNNCTNLKTIYASSNFITTQVTSSSSMFSGDTKLVGGQGTIYNSSKIDKTYAHIDGGTSDPGYFTSKPPVRVKFDPNGRYLENRVFYYNVGDTLGTLPVVEDSTSVFLGWFTDLTGGIQIDENTVVDSSVTFYAHWYVIPYYSIYFDKNNSNATGEMSAQSIRSDMTKPINENAFKLSSYAFVGWNTERDGSGTSYLDKEDINLEHNITLYAQWIKTYTLTFDKNDSSAVGETYSMTLLSGVPTLISTDAFEAYTLDNQFIESYNTNRENTGISYYESQSITITSDTTLYAHWKIPELVTITFNPNVEGMDNITKEILERETLGELPAPERTDYKLIGWFTERTDGVQITEDTIVKEEVTYYARWQLKEAIFDSGQNVNVKMKNLANNRTDMNYYYYIDNSIKSIERSNSLPLDFTPTSNNNVASPDSAYPIYIWFDNTVGVLYYYCEKELVYLNTNSSYMFSYMYYLESAPDLSNLDTSKVTNMSYMFYYAGYADTNFNLDLSNWDTSNVTNMAFLFYSAGRNSKSFNLNLNNWNTSKVTNMSYMFFCVCYETPTFNLSMSNWNTSKVTNMEYMFAYMGYNSTTVNLELKKWNASNTTNMSYMYYYVGHNSKKVDLDLRNWDVSNATNMSNMFYSIGYYANELSINLSDWNTSKAIDMNYMFCYVGYNAYTIYINLNNWDTSNVINMSNMFYYVGNNSEECTLEGLSNWNTSKVTNMSRMFSGFGSGSNKFYLGDLSNWDTSNVTDMSSMFYSVGYNSVSWSIGDLSNWDTSNVTDMSDMFYDAGYSATTFDIGDLSNWNTSNVTNMSIMFCFAGYNATVFNIGNLSNWDTSNVTDMSDMFGYAGHNSINWTALDLSNWDTSNVTKMFYMFRGSPLKTIYASNKFVTTQVTNSTKMFDNAIKLVGGQGTTYNPDIIDKTYAHLDGGASNPGYFTERPPIKITFDPSGGQASLNNNYYNIGDVLGELPTAKKEKNVLIGWFTEVNGGVQIDENTIVSENVTYYAHWRQAEKYTITFDPNVEGMDNIIREVYEDSELGLLPIITRNDYNLLGWYTKRTGGKEISYVTIPTSNTTYYARWVEKGAILDSGYSVNAKIKNLANNKTDMTLKSADTVIKSIVRSDSLPAGFTPTDNNNIASRSSIYPIFIWFDNITGTINIYSEKETIYLNHTSSYLFSEMEKLQSAPCISTFNTSYVIDMSNMFNHAGFNATSFDMGDLSNWNTSRVINMSNMFNHAGYNATTFDIGNLNNWDTSKVKDMSYMFNYASYNSTTWTIGDLSSWDTSNVIDMKLLFCRAGYKNTTFILDLSNWNTSRVTDMSYMLDGVGYEATTWSIGDIGKWNTSNVTTMSDMLYSCKNLKILDLTGWDTSSVTNMRSMFYNCTNLETIYVSNKFITSKVTDSTDMFYNAPKLVGGQGTTYNSSNTDKTYAHIDGGVSNPGYFTIRPNIKVTFNSNGGILTDRYRYYNVGDSLGTLPVPVRENKVFIGWFTGLLDGVQVDENTILSDDVVYYAHWSDS